MEAVFVRFVPAGFFRKPVYGTVADNSLCRKRCAEHQAFQRLATAQCHIRLPMCKGCAGIDNGTLKRKPLTLVDCNGPRQFQGKLPESTFNIFYNLPALFVQDVFCICPLLFLQQESIPAVFGAYLDTLGRNGGYLTNHTVVVAVLAGRVVLHEHHLSAFFQFENFVRGV